MACLLKSHNSGRSVCILDKRKHSTRNHGLKIQKDSVQQIDKLFDEILKKNPSEEVRDLKNLFLGWKNKFVKTSEIESKLHEIAKDLNVAILQSDNYSVQGNNLDTLLQKKSKKNLNKIIQNAKVIIAADGAHSEIRKKVMGDKKVH